MNSLDKHEIDYLVKVLGDEVFNKTIDHCASRYIGDVDMQLWLDFDSGKYVVNMENPETHKTVCIADGIPENKLYDVMMALAECGTDLDAIKKTIANDYLKELPKQLVLRDSDGGSDEIVLRPDVTPSNATEEEKNLAESLIIKIPRPEEEIIRWARNVLTINREEPVTEETIAQAYEKSKTELRSEQFASGEASLGNVKFTVYNQDDFDNRNTDLQFIINDNDTDEHLCTLENVPFDKYKDTLREIANCGRDMNALKESSVKEYITKIYKTNPAGKSEPKDAGKKEPKFKGLEM